MTRPIVVLCGGVGAAKLLRGLIQVVPAERLVAVVNVADDMVLHGLSISPDLDTITYTLADAVSLERGWGLEGESWQAMTMLKRYGGQAWFGLGDRDLGTHLYRTQRLSEGATLSEVTAEIARAWDLPLTLTPVSNDRISTIMTTAEFGDISFQRYFVGHQHDVVVTAVRFDGAAAATAAPGVVAALEAAERIIIAPSNPVVSIDPVLAVPEVGEILRRRRSDVVAISPIIGGKALKGPADRLLTELGRQSSVVGVAEWYRDVIGTLIIDQQDSALAADIEAIGLGCRVLPTIMSTPEDAAALGAACLQ